MAHMSVFLFFAFRMISLSGSETRTDCILLKSGDVVCCLMCSSLIHRHVYVPILIHMYLWTDNKSIKSISLELKYMYYMCRCIEVLRHRHVIQEQVQVDAFFVDISDLLTILHEAVIRG